MIWLILIACGRSDAPNPAELQGALRSAEERIEELEAEVEGYRRRMDSIARLDQAMESAHTLVAARCAQQGSDSTPETAKYRMDSTGWGEIVAEPSAVLAQGRWIPHGGPDNPTGWRLVRIARGGLLDSCGLKSADVLQAINGVSMVKQGGPLEALEAADGDGIVQLELLRNRKPFVLTIHRGSD